MIALKKGPYFICNKDVFRTTSVTTKAPVTVRVVAVMAAAGVKPGALNKYIEPLASREPNKSVF